MRKKQNVRNFRRFLFGSFDVPTVKVRALTSDFKSSLIWIKWILVIDILNQILLTLLTIIMIIALQI